MNTEERGYTVKELLMSRPSVIERVKQSKGETLSAKTLAKQRRPSYRNNFLGKNLKIIAEMNGIRQVNQDSTRHNVYSRDKEYLENFFDEGREVELKDLDEIQNVFREIYDARIIKAFHDNQDPVKAAEELEDREIRLDGDNSSVILEDIDIESYSDGVALYDFKNRPDYSEPFLELLSELSIIEGVDDKEVTADLKELDYLVEKTDDWKMLAESLENNEGLPEWANNQLEQAASYFEGSGDTWLERFD